MISLPLLASEPLPLMVIVPLELGLEPTVRPAKPDRVSAPGQGQRAGSGAADGLRAAHL